MIRPLELVGPVGMVELAEPLLAQEGVQMDVVVQMFQNLFR